MGIEIYAEDYMEWRICQPLILLHEFVHSFHTYIGRELLFIVETYNMAMKKHLYDNVQHKLLVNNESVTICKRGYAESNYYPFNRKQIKEHDYDAYKLCKAIWSLTSE